MNHNHFKGVINLYKGFEIEATDIPESPEAFSAKMTHSIYGWVADNIEVVWLSIPESSSTLIPTALQFGFSFHHTEKDRLVLVKKMHPSAFVIPYASHYIGVGGVVLDENNRLLVVREFYKNGSSAHYKLPGGTLECAEHIEDAVIREVYEETGIRTVFNSLICFRHRHHFRFDKSDIYFICLLTPLNSEIIAEKDEIAEAVWMNVQEYLSHDKVHALNKEIIRAALQGNVLIKKDIVGYQVDKSEFEIFLP